MGFGRTTGLKKFFSERNAFLPKTGCSFSCFSKALLYNMWLFHLHSTVKNRAFFPVFPLVGSTAKAFCMLSLWNFKEKSINHFLEHSRIKKEGSRNSLPIEANRNRRQPTSIRKRTSGSQHHGSCFHGSHQQSYPKHFHRGRG